ncbi:pyrroloquinoline quinone-dependent dehydrogenase [Limobrevibacterium gyesilva]|uniref:PQQ-binding-like beta-propeller repeat protein n=1 Tax=Limobrevibacterium gyesilva TaxID=2991712 RepID=A0AA42CJ52_9PROT|nr:PQQ-binding-like beta-propeller repeat protein [Limobrevibacterium gyesilva]MCW3476582.1 PQQ-binding-like beta-propeller repeat protein [Limobrevibacterium gyesilva]
MFLTGRLFDARACLVRAAAVAGLLGLACGPAHAAGPSQDELDKAQSNTKDWLYATHDYTGQRFVDLKQINAANVHQLHVVCIYRSTDEGPVQTNPLVYNGVMYFTVARSIVAVDAATCRERWKYAWEPKGGELSPTNRGAAIKDGLVIRGTADGYLIAVDAAKGTLAWSRQIASANQQQYLSMPPLIFGDLVIYGPAGADWGQKGWVGAFRLATGEPVWKFNLIPDPGEPGAESWGNPEALKTGGASLWTPLSLDAKKGVLYLPVGNPAPDFYADHRPGNNLYTNSIVALDVRTGTYLWHYQAVPQDVRDWDLDQAGPLFSATVKGKRRDVIVASGKDGMLRLLDRDTHEVLYEVPFTTRSNVDVPLTPEGVRSCPGLLGGQEWNGAAYDPASQTLFVPAVDWCTTFKKAATTPAFAQGEHFYGGTAEMDPWAQAHGWLTAIDAATGKPRWRYKSSTPMLAAVTATAGGLVFTGDFNHDFLALDAASGKVLYRFNTGGEVAGGVVTYAIGGKQYVATMSGYVSVFFKGSGPAAVVVFGL